jgi:hypothetical protein
VLGSPQSQITIIKDNFPSKVPLGTKESALKIRSCLRCERTGAVRLAIGNEENLVASVPDHFRVRTVNELLFPCQKCDSAELSRSDSIRDELRIPRAC